LYWFGIVPAKNEFSTRLVQFLKKRIPYQDQAGMKV
jgi:hypothetical protein